MGTDWKTYKNCGESIVNSSEFELPTLGTHSEDAKRKAKFFAVTVVGVGQCKFLPKEAIAAVSYDGDKGWTMVKRFLIETTTTGNRYKFITDHKDSKLQYAHSGDGPVIEYSWKSKNQKFTKEFKAEEFIDVKGWKALRNRLSEYKLVSIKGKESEPGRAKGKDDIEFEIVTGTQKKLF